VKRALLLLVAIACSKQESEFKSNFSTVRFEGAQILTDKGAPFSGELVARDKEIDVVAAKLLGDTYRYAEDTNPTGLVVVVPVDKGVASGKAIVYVDLFAPKLNPEVERRSETVILVARARSKSIKLAEATFKAGKLDGVATVFAPEPKTGKPTKVAEVTFRDHVLNGAATEFFPGSPQHARDLVFENGRQHGVQKTFFENGKPRSTGEFANGKPVGKHESWYPNGQRASEVVFENGEPTSQQRWYSNGASTDQPRNGPIEEFHNNGVVRAKTTYTDGRKNGPHQEWWMNGQLAVEATYVNDVLEGDYKRFYASGKPWELAKYERGVRVGPYKKWWKNGKPAHDYTYKQGQLDGDYKQHYDNGKKWVSAKYVDGKPRGALERWWPDGKLAYVLQHDDKGRPHGDYKRWWPSGRPRLEATYVDGRLDGEFKNWLEDGKEYEMATFQRGVKIKTTREAPPQQ
jgi:antitoxin component YwqK of YwqJK toxin-antitoxin module